MIQINNLVKKFDDFTALDGVNMNVEKGAVYGLVGPNGAGKSTLIRHITGVMRQDAGEVFIDGEPVYENAGIKGQMAGSLKMRSLRLKRKREKGIPHCSGHIRQIL